MNAFLALLAGGGPAGASVIASSRGLTHNYPFTGVATGGATGEQAAVTGGEGASPATSSGSIAKADTLSSSAADASSGGWTGWTSSRTEWAYRALGLPLPTDADPAKVFAQLLYRMRHVGYALSDEEAKTLRRCEATLQERALVFGCATGALVNDGLKAIRPMSGSTRAFTVVGAGLYAAYVGARTGARGCLSTIVRLEDSKLGGEARAIVRDLAPSDPLGFPSEPPPAARLPFAPERRRREREVGRRVDAGDGSAGADVAADVAEAVAFDKEANDGDAFGGEASSTEGKSTSTEGESTSTEGEASLAANVAADAYGRHRSPRVDARRMARGQVASRDSLDSSSDNDVFALAGMRANQSGRDAWAWEDVDAERREDAPARSPRRDGPGRASTSSSAARMKHQQDTFESRRRQRMYGWMYEAEARGGGREASEAEDADVRFRTHRRVPVPRDGSERTATGESTRMDGGGRWDADIRDGAVDVDAAGDAERRRRLQREASGRRAVRRTAYGDVLDG